MTRNRGSRSAVLFNLLLVLCLPVLAFTCMVLYVHYRHEISQVPGLEWFTPIEDFFQSAETPLPILLVLGVFFLFYALTYVLSFFSRCAVRPIKRVLFLDILLGAVAACYIASAAVVPLYEFVAPLVFLAIPALGWLIERLAGRALSSLATWLVDREQYGQANAVLAMALRFEPNNRRLQRGLGLARYDAGDVVGAIDVLEPLGADDNEDEQVLRILEECFHTERDWPRALDIGQRLLKLHPEDNEQRLRVAAVLERLDRPQEAIELTRQALPTKDIELLEELVRMHTTAGEPAKACEVRQRIEEIEGGPQPRAFAVHQSLVEAFPENSEVLEGFAEFLIRHRRPNEGFALIEKIVAVSPMRHDLRKRLVKKYQEDGQIDRAEPHLVALMDAGRDTKDVVLLYGDMLIQREEYDKALMHFQYAVENYRDDYRFPYFLAQISLKTQALEDAARWCDEAVRRAKDDEARSRVRALRARVEESIVNRDLQVLQDRCRRDPANIETRIQLIETMVRHGMADQAVGEYEILIENHPELRSRVIEQLARLARDPDCPFRLMDYLFDLRLKNGQADEALELARSMSAKSIHGTEMLEEHCRAILTRAPEHAPTLKAMADVLFDAKKWSQALDCEARLETLGVAPEEDRLLRVLDAATELRDFARATQAGERLVVRNPDDVELRMRVADMYVRQAMFDRALEHLRAAQSKDYHNADVIHRMQDLAKKRSTHRIEQLEEKIRQDPKDGAARLEAGDLYMEKNQPKKAVAHYQHVPADSPLRNLSRAKLARAMTDLGMYDLVDETLDETNLDVADPDEAKRLKTLVYEIADMLETEAEHTRALGLFKKIFRVDAGYRDVVDRIEALSD